jgi:hypothetical protein
LGAAGIDRLSEIEAAFVGVRDGEEVNRSTVMVTSGELTRSCIKGKVDALLVNSVDDAFSWTDNFAAEV